MMVQINLLPGKRKSVQSGNDKYLLIAAVLVLVSVLGVCALMFFDQKAEFQSVKIQDAKQTKKLKIIKREIKGIGNVENERERFNRRKMVISTLASERIGPRHVLDELKNVLNAPNSKTPRLLQFAKVNGWNLEWDPTNIELRRFAEESDVAEMILIEGSALSYEDVAEFWLRLKTSPFFEQVRLPYIEKGKSNKSKINVQNFQITAIANFRYRTASGKRLASQLDSLGNACSQDSIPTSSKR